MNGTVIGSTVEPLNDSTFGFIAARAACYPVILRSSQVRIIRRGPARDPPAGDAAIQWLLLNTQQINRVLKGAGLGANDIREFATNRFLEQTGWSEPQFAMDRCIRGTG